MNILVTGATGFLGNAICKRLCQDGHHIIAFHRYSSALTQISELPIQRVIGDIHDEISLANAFKNKPDVVIHLAARSMATRYVNNRQPEGTNTSALIETNAGGTRRVLQAAYQANTTKVIVASSALTMGYAVQNEDPLRVPGPIDETHCWEGNSQEWSFTWSKILMEQEVQWATSIGMNVSICCPFFIAGAGDHYRSYTHFLLRLRNHMPTVAFNGGINILHIDDAVEAFTQAITHGKSGERYILGGENISFQHLLEKISAYASKAPPKLQLGTALANHAFKIKNKYQDIFPTHEMDFDLLHLAGKFFYYNGEKARLAFHLPPPRGVDLTIRDTFQWFEKESQ